MLNVHEVEWRPKHEEKQQRTSNQGRKISPMLQFEIQYYAMKTWLEGRYYITLNIEHPV